MSKKLTSRDKLLDVTFEEVYRFGYCGAGTATILKKAGVPRGSMYHHFPSKKAMVIAMIEERLIPKIRDFFEFKIKKSSTGLELVNEVMGKLSKNKMLVTHGCPLHRLMFEMDALDSDIALLCSAEFEHLSENLQKILLFGMRDGSIREMDAKNLAEFIISSTWGILSKPAVCSSEEQFLRDS
ncbi:TetR/AcrR family transcriptional regulator, partial [Sulfurovum sp. bin170]|uniref:TetR/AcrR family transcriptional regulator n=1 Tax=Sulfurovum sp. bin170 TaxID=2695268 RepID=UPI0013DFFC43